MYIIGQGGWETGEIIRLLFGFKIDAIGFPGIKY